MKKITPLILFAVLGCCLLAALVGGAALFLSEGETPAAETQPLGEEPAPEAETASEESESQPEPAPETGESPLGFDPQQNGFSFPNYGDDLPVTNLTPAELRRMFGDQVCADLNGEECILTPPAEQWMEQINGAMAGGHCEGMAALSMMMYTGQIPPQDFGGEFANQLSIEDEALQRELAYWWATQTVAPTYASVVRGTPMEILQIVQEMDPNTETYTIGIYNAEGSGHAITPVGVQDKGDGMYAILVYDNNYPGETRELLVDSRDDSWTYETSINPQVESDVWSGNAETATLDLTPTSARLVEQECPFCSGEASSALGAKLAAPAPQYNQIFLDGEGHILITDENGKRLGYVDGKIVNEIAGASYTQFRMEASMNAPEPIYSLPAGLDVTIEVDGSDLAEETLTDLVLIGPGYSIGIEQIYLTPGQVDIAYFYPQEGGIAYETLADESPSIIFGIENPAAAADYYFEIYGADITGGGIITAWLDDKAGDLLINTEKLNAEGEFNFYMTRITEELEEEFSAEAITLQEGALVYINYAEWTDENPEGMYFGVDLNGDGEIDDEYIVEDYAE